MPPPRRRGSRRHIQNSRRPPSSVSRTDLAGLIMWLPQRDGLRKHSELPEGCYGHPVVVLSPQASATDDVVILILTSFCKTNIIDKYPNNPKRRLTYLPIHPTDPHPDTAAQLHLKNHAELELNSYVNTGEKHTIPFGILRPYDRHDTNNTLYALTSDSYQQLINHARFVPPVCLPTTSVPTTTTTTTVTTPRPVLPDASENRRPQPQPLRYDDSPVPASLSYGTPTAQQQQQQHRHISPSLPPDTLPSYYSPAPRQNNNNGDNAWWDGPQAAAAPPTAAARTILVTVVALGASLLGLWSAWAWFRGGGRPGRGEGGGVRRAPWLSLA
ncbi:hypothetical protein C8A00DRAFT_28687 [Chaetomidium leptoderma]|uniref:Uncharacterized protein n=1 Tax=Chaetomidium leptoderma TaxID=669021 RepID=A0AAN7A1A3_9PEZI|nr:hypothetical protein C8A00DRAFT_28687 [Chaetomidium leptoderma]